MRTNEAKKQALKSMTVGRTRVLWGKVVTRWTNEVWEVGTWGRKSQNLDEAAEALDN